MSKTALEMAQSVGAVNQDLLDRHTEYVVFTNSQLEAFAELVRADEREVMLHLAISHGAPWHFREAIYARSNT